MTDIHHDTLDNGKLKLTAKPDTIKRPKECPQCSYLRPVGINKCPNCGFEVRVFSKIRNAKGELREFKGKDRPQDKIVNAMDVARQLKHIALERGYKPGWAYHKTPEYCGYVPPGYNSANPAPPSAHIRSWVQSRIIAYARANERKDETKDDKINKDSGKPEFQVHPQPADKPAPINNSEAPWEPF